VIIYFGTHRYRLGQLVQQELISVKMLVLHFSYKMELQLVKVLLKRDNLQVQSLLDIWQDQQLKM